MQEAFDAQAHGAICRSEWYAAFIPLVPKHVPPVGLCEYEAGL